MIKEIKSKSSNIISTPIIPPEKQIDKNFEQSKKIHEEYLEKSANTDLDPKPLTINDLYSTQNNSAPINLTKYLKYYPKFLINFYS